MQRMDASSESDRIIVELGAVMDELKIKSDENLHYKDKINEMLEQ